MEENKVVLRKEEKIKVMEMVLKNFIGGYDQGSIDRLKEMYESAIELLSQNPS